ncbi:MULTISPECIES: hypothetical protein [Bacillus subtilis group]|uniref:hypothetical protein n=1 Tax=Bacillus subtilis group TaxID=653685 RepID=UPI000A08908B|nr:MULTISPECIES: hypothetical protein [Bacillus subtilis group]MBJ3767015.1 hypothetical protein [Bacillus subtilis]MCY7683149.1 hypothetical protein [Bacillus velezensis]MDI6685426.1 hypothetical protein [Bacillus subtilis]MED4458362.1 hypothetical protein [Bacillus subtilis]OUL03425.1 hypothetical protein B0W20_17035 [Bacillus spizizenii]
MSKYTLSEIMTTSELAQKLDYNQAYVLRLVKEKLTEGVEYRSAGRRNYLFTPDALTKLQEVLNQTN